MKFEVKKIDVLGGTKTKDENNSSQMINISVGVVGCPYLDIVANKMVEYVFSNSMSIQAVKDGIPTFADAWVTENYPEVI